MNDTVTRTGKSPTGSGLLFIDNSWYIVNFFGMLSKYLGPVLHERQLTIAPTAFGPNGQNWLNSQLPPKGSLKGEILL